GLVAAGGDAVAGPPSDALSNLVTPTLPLSFAGIILNGIYNGGPTASFVISWYGNDPGDAASLRWLDMTDPTSPTVLAYQQRVGPWNEYFVLDVPVPSGDPSLLVVEGAAVATSTPEPASVALVALGLLTLAGVARRRPA